MKEKSIVIAFGGVSPEHEVSVLTAMQAISALEQTSKNIIPLYISKSGKWFTGDYLKTLEHFEDLDHVVRNSVPCTFAHNELGQPVLFELKSGLFKKPGSHKIDAALVAFHGSDGENGSFQGICETFNIPYTGCGVLTSAIGMDKVTAKSLCRSNEIPVADDVHFYESEWEKNRGQILHDIESLEYPVVVKPVHLGSSIGVNIVKDRKSLTEAIELGFRYDEHLLVEKAITPLMEINCSVIGTKGDYKTSVCERPVSGEELLSFRDKYQSESGDGKGMASADRVIPADISEDLTEQIQKTTLEIFSLFDGTGLARLDFLVNADTDEFYFNEINTIPGSYSYYLWEETDMNFRQLLEELIRIARERHRRKNGRIQSYETNLLSQKAVKGMKGLKGNKTNPQKTNDA